MSDAPRSRCDWGPFDPDGTEAMTVYHDTVWGTPLHDDRGLFEMFTLQVFQAGLSWRLILSRADAFRRAFDDFDIETVAGYTEPDIARLLDDASIIRNRKKIEATIDNAQAALDAIDTSGSLDTYLWSFVGGAPIVHEFTTVAELPAHTPESEAMSKQMRGDGFRFAGPTVLYAFMQAAGLVNDHIVDCFRWKEVQA